MKIKAKHMRLTYKHAMKNGFMAVSDVRMVSGELDEGYDEKSGITVHGSRTACATGNGDGPDSGASPLSRMGKQQVGQGARAQSPLSGKR